VQSFVTLNKKTCMQSMRRVVDCKDALPFLQQCLPQLRDCFDDCNVAVRGAMVKLLLRLQALRLIK
jgi:hypothetical protein